MGAIESDWVDERGRSVPMCDSASHLEFSPAGANAASFDCLDVLSRLDILLRRVARSLRLPSFV